jgi:PEP-CTERM motif
VDSNVSGAGLSIFSAVSGNGTLTINLQSALNGPVLGSATSTLSFPSGVNTAFYDVFFGTPIEVTPGSTLFLNWSANLPGAATLRADDNTYANGQLYSGTIALPDRDMGFRIYTDPNFTPGPGPTPGPTTTPEPSSLILLGGGLAMLTCRTLMRSRVKNLRRP